MLDPETPEDAREKLTGDVRGRIEAAGELRHDENWGLRKLAYEIEKRNEADYRFFRFQGEPQLLDELGHSLKIAEGVLRFRVFGVDPRTPVGAAPPPVQAARPPRESRGGRDGRPRRSDGDSRGRGDRDEQAAGAGSDSPPAESPQPEASVGADEAGTASTGDAPAEEAGPPASGDSPPDSSAPPAAADQPADAGVPAASEAPIPEAGGAQAPAEPASADDSAEREPPAGS